MFISAATFNLVILLNLVIAIISDVFTRVLESQIRSFYKERCDLIAEVGTLIPIIFEEKTAKTALLFFATEHSAKQIADDHAAQELREAEEHTAHMEKLATETHEKISAIKKKMDDEDDNDQDSDGGENIPAGEKGIRHLAYMIEKLTDKLQVVDSKVDSQTTDIQKKLKSVVKKTNTILQANSIPANQAEKNGSPTRFNNERQRADPVIGVDFRQAMSPNRRGDGAMRIENDSINSPSEQYMYGSGPNFYPQQHMTSDADLHMRNHLDSQPDGDAFDSGLGITGNRYLPNKLPHNRPASAAMRSTDRSGSRGRANQARNTS
jgi:hypothetical protein